MNTSRQLPPITFSVPIRAPFYSVEITQSNGDIWSFPSIEAAAEWLRKELGLPAVKKGRGQRRNRRNTR